MLRQWPHIESIEDIRADVRPYLVAVFKCTGDGWIELKTGKRNAGNLSSPVYTPSVLGGYEMNNDNAAAAVYFDKSQFPDIYDALISPPFTVLSTASSVSNVTTSMAAFSVGSEAFNRGWALKGEQWSNTGDIGLTKKGVVDITFSTLETVNVAGFFGVILNSGNDSIGFSSEGTESSSNTQGIGTAGGSFERIYIGGEQNSAGYRGRLGPYIFCFDRSLSESEILAFAKNPDTLVRSRLLEMIPTWAVSAVGGGGTTYEESITFTTNAGATNAATGVLVGSASFGLSAAQSLANIATMEAAASLGLQNTATAAANLVIEASATIAASVGQSDGGALTLNQALTLAQSLSITNSAIATLDASAILAITNAVAGASNLIADASATFPASLAILAQDASNTFDEAVTLAIAKNLVGTSQAAFSDALTLAISKALTISAQNVMQASASLGSSAGVSASGGLAFNESTSYAATFTVSSAPAYVLAGNLTLAQALGVTATSQADLVGGLSLSATLSAAAASNAILNVTTTLAGQFTVSALGTVAGVSITTPDGRTLLILADDRTLSIQADDRRLTIN